MDFLEIAAKRQSTRAYDATRVVENEKLERVLEATRLAPSACNGQPYHITVCLGETKEKVARAVMGMGMNSFAKDAPVLIVLSEEDYCRTAAVGAKLKKNDYRSLDIGIAVAYLTAEAHTQGLSTCILGWLDDGKIREACALTQPARLVVALGYAKADEKQREKKRKSIEEIVSFKE